MIGHPVVGCKFHLQEGASHIVDSNEYSFRTATMQAFRQAYEKAAPAILEPIMRATICIPIDTQGSVMSSLTKRRGIIIDSDASADGSTTTITAEVPLADMFGYSTELRSSTQGKGEFSMEYVEHRPVSKDLQAELVTKKNTPLKN